MGVTGLWQVLEPASRPTNVQALAHKVVAVDISIWLYQLVRGMRGPDGQMVTNAHLQGCFTRICELLKHEVRPIFVFDGAAPMLKKLALDTRRKRRLDGENNVQVHHRRLLQNHIRRHALGDSDAVLPPRVRAQREDDTYVLEPLPASEEEGRQESGSDTDAGSAAAVTLDGHEEGEEGAAKLAGPALVSSAPASSAPEAEVVKLLLDSSQIDVFSDDFAELPAEVQHEIIRDLQEKQKNKSRSHRVVFADADSFSNQQLQGVVQRHRLNEKLVQVRERLLNAEKVDGVTARKIVSDDSTIYYLEKRNPVQADAGPARPAAAAPTAASEAPGSSSTAEERAVAARNKLLLQLRASRADNDSDGDDASSISFASDSGDASPMSLSDGEGPDRGAPAEPPAVAPAAPPAAADEGGPEPAWRRLGHEVGRRHAQEIITTVVESSDSEELDQSQEAQVQAAASTTGDSAADAPAPARSDTTRTPPEPQPAKAVDPVAAPAPAPAPAPASEMSAAAVRGAQKANAGPVSVTAKAPLDEKAAPSTIRGVPHTAPPTAAMSEEGDEDDDDDLVSVAGSDAPPIDAQPSKPDEPAQPLRAPTPEPAHTPTPPPPSEALVPGMEVDDLATEEGLREAQEILRNQSAELRGAVNAAARTAAGITSDMINEVQAMLRLFGVPFIVAPSEAEAQCAHFDATGVTSGTITNDNDVLLFGGQRVYRHLFFSDKMPKLVRSRDVKSLLGLERQDLINLAYLMGCDYTRGIYGVGPVTAMEVLAEFRGEGCLTDFKEWLVQAQKSELIPPKEAAVLKQLRGRVKSLVVPPRFPDARIGQAFLQPDVDESTEEFEWGVPNLVAIREFASFKFGWANSRTDELVLPILKAINARRGQAKIHTFFGSHVGAPLGMPAVESRRLQSALHKVSGGGIAMSPPKKRKRRKTTAPKKRPRKRKITPFSLFMDSRREDAQGGGPAAGGTTDAAAAAAADAPATLTEAALRAEWRKAPRKTKQAWKAKADHAKRRQAEAAELADACVQDDGWSSSESEPETTGGAGSPGTTAGTAPDGPPVRTVEINRGPVLTLWVAVVAARRGYAWDAAVTFGRAIANRFATAKGRSIGVIAGAAGRGSGRGGAVERPDMQVDLLGEDIPVDSTAQGLRALDRGRPIRPQLIHSYLNRSFGSHQLKYVRAAMEALAARYPDAMVLNGDAYGLYCRFRPNVPAGQAGWGKKGVLSLDAITALWPPGPP